MRLDEFGIDRRVIITPSIEHRQYASEYYDPVKAHEYYERTKQLKGTSRNTSTSGLNEEGKKAALYVKKQIDEQHKAELEKHNEEVKAEREKASEDTKSKIDAATKELKSQTEAMKVRLKKMNPAQRKHAEIQMRAEIEKMKKANAENRKALMEAYGETSKSISEAANEKRKQIGNTYTNKYADELEKMAQDSSMAKVKRSSSGSGKSGGGYVFEYRRKTQGSSK